MPQIQLLVILKDYVYYHIHNYNEKMGHCFGTNLFQLYFQTMDRVTITFDGQSVEVMTNLAPELARKLIEVALAHTKANEPEKENELREQVRN